MDVTYYPLGKFRHFTPEQMRQIIFVIRRGQMYPAEVAAWQGLLWLLPTYRQNSFILEG